MGIDEENVGRSAIWPSAPCSSAERDFDPSRFVPLVPSGDCSFARSSRALPPEQSPPDQRPGAQGPGAQTPPERRPVENTPGAQRPGAWKRVEPTVGEPMIETTRDDPYSPSKKSNELCTAATW